MRIDLNLANEPFRNRSLFWMGLAIAYLVVLMVGVVVVARSSAVDVDADRLNHEVETQKQEIEQLEKRIAERKREEGAAVFDDRDRAALDDARELINRKSVSWSWLLAEIERYVPDHSRLTSITIADVEGTGQAKVVTLQLEIFGQDQRQVQLMISKFDESQGRFAAEPVTIAPITDGSGFNYTLDVAYRPAVGATHPLPPAGDPVVSGSKKAAADEEDGDDE